MEDFTLSFQAQLPPLGDTINLRGANEVAFALLGHPAVMRVEDRWVTLKVSGLADPADGSEWVQKLGTAFAWTMLRHDLPFKPIRKLEVVSLAAGWDNRPRTPRSILGKDFPEGLDAVEDRGLALLYPTGAIIARIGMGDVTVSVGRAWEPIADSLNQGVSMAYPSERLSTALDLWAAASYEVSAAARLLTYVMAIESLVSPKRKHPRAQAFIDDWISALKREVEPECDLDARDSLEALCEEIQSRREESVMKGIRRILRRSFESAGMADDTANALADLKTVYEARSKLVHEGILRQPDSVGRAKDLSRKILTAVMQAGVED